MKINVLYFARSREVTGTSEEQFDLPEGSTTALFLETLKARHPDLVGVLRSCVFAVNHEYVQLDQSVTLKDGDEVAIIPPLSGG